MHDLIIIGGGPAGLTAAVYALNKRVETLLISEDLGGKTLQDFQLEAREGEAGMPAAEVVAKFKHQLEYLNFAHQQDWVTKIVPEDHRFVVLTQDNKRYEASALVIATGALPKRLHVPGEQRLAGRGVSYSTMSHAPWFVEREAALVGRDDGALRSAAQLAMVAKRVHLIVPAFVGQDSALGQKLRGNPRVTLYENTELKQVRGDQFAKSIVVHTKGRTEEIPVDGVFIEMGSVPSSKFAADLRITDSRGGIIVNRRGATKCPGVFAAGDVTDVIQGQLLIALSEGAKAALSAYDYLLNQ